MTAYDPKLTARWLERVRKEPELFSASESAVDELAAQLRAASERIKQLERALREIAESDDVSNVSTNDQDACLHCFIVGLQEIAKDALASNPPVLDESSEIARAHLDNVQKP